MLETAINSLVKGFTLIGDGFTLLLIALFKGFGVDLPDWAARLSMLGVSALVVWRFQTAIPKLILVAVAILSASILMGFL